MPPMIVSKVQLNTDGTVGFMSDFWTLTAASEQVGYPASNLLTPDPKQKWVSWGQRASHNWIQIASDEINVDRVISIAGLLGLDRTNPDYSLVGDFTDNTYRIIVDQFPIADRRRMSVDTVSLTNLVGAASVLNGPINPPDLVPVGYVSTKLTTPNPALNTVLIADFENWNSVEWPLDNTKPHSLRVHVVHSNSGGPPTIQTRLRYAGSLIGSNLFVDSVEQTSEGYIYHYVIEAGSIPGSTGQVGVQVTGITTGSSTPLPIGVEYIAELDGWNFDSLVDPTQDEIIRQQQIVELPKNSNGIGEYLIPAYNLAYVYIEVSDWAEVVNIGSGIYNYTPLGGFQNSAFFAGRLVVAEGITIPLRDVGGYNARKASDINLLRTYGGSLRGVRNPLHWSEYDFVALWEEQSSVFGDLDAFFERCGMRNPVVMIPDQNNPSLALYVLLTKWDTPDVGLWTPGSGDADAEHHYELSFSAVDVGARRTP